MNNIFNIETECIFLPFSETVLKKTDSFECGDKDLDEFLPLAENFVTEITNLIQI